MKIKPIYVLILLIVMTSILSSILYNSLLKGKDNYTSDNLSAIFGTTRKTISSHFYDKADLYFHRGIDVICTGHNNQKKAIAMQHDHEGYHDINHEHQHHDKEIGGSLKNLVFELKNPMASFYSTMQRATVPSGHFHRSGEEAKEILPWIYLAVKLDPTNDELYRTIAYWLRASFGRNDLRAQIYDLAQQNLPYNPAIKLEQGLMFLDDNNQEEAIKKFEAALNFMNLQPEEQQEHYLKANILLEMAVIYEKQGRNKKALEAYQQIHQQFPERQSTVNKIEELLTQ